jgi:hypothetical protein
MESREYMKNINPIPVRFQNPKIFKNANLTSIIFSYLFVKDMQNFNFTNRTIYHTMQRVYTKEIEVFKQVTLYFLRKFNQKPDTIRNHYALIDTEEINTVKAAIKLLNILMCHGFNIFPIFDHILPTHLQCAFLLYDCSMLLTDLEAIQMELCYDSESAMFHYVSKNPKRKLKIPLFYLLTNQSWMPEPKNILFSLRFPCWSINAFTLQDQKINRLFNGEFNGSKIQYSVSVKVSVDEQFFHDGDKEQIFQTKKVPPKYCLFGKNQSCKYICDNFTGYEKKKIKQSKKIIFL